MAKQSGNPRDGAPMVGAKADLKPLGRLIRLLFRDYPVTLCAVMDLHRDQRRRRHSTRYLY